ncbi:hypothetical protein DH2020_001409 [Rehmannia glutinosa]|uniref:Uncharacterized protein n=1 Tax=Rehmannia glutinosa TaxID=99300 RepID=A0ABR0XZ98_REHGL
MSKMTIDKQGHLDRYSVIYTQEFVAGVGGRKREEAVTVIEKENRNVNAIVVKDGTPVPLDFRCDRVWVWVNDYGVVIRTPTIG